MKICAFVTILAFLLSGCADYGSNKQVVRIGPSQYTKILNQKRVAIIADVGLRRNDNTAGSYFSINDSKTSAQSMIESAKTYLTTNGYDVIFAEAETIGSYLEAADSIKFAAEKGGRVGEMFPPLFVAESLETDPIYRQSLTKMIHSTLNEVGQKTKPSSDVWSYNADIKDALRVISQKTGANAILFLVGNGSIVSGGERVAQQIVTGLITGILTQGMLVYTQWNISFLDTYAALVDTETGELLWSKSLRLKGKEFTDRNSYSKWPHYILQDYSMISESYVGCFKDEGETRGTSGRDLSGHFVFDRDMTIDLCVFLCRNKGYKYAGVQYSKECFCGNNYGIYGVATNCNYLCSGNENLICGGFWANSIYRTYPDQKKEL